MHIVNSYPESIAKLETQLGQLTIAVGKREEGKLLSHPIQNPKSLQFEKLEDVIVLGSGKEVDNNVNEKEHDKEERLKTIESDLKTEKENDLSPSLLCLIPLADGPLLSSFRYTILFQQR